MSHITSHNTQGIIIKRTNLGEADRILTIFTERFGKIKAIAKGVRKRKSRLAGYLEPYMLIDLQVHEGKTFYIITGAGIVNGYPILRSDLKRLSEVYYAAELLNEITKEDESHQNIFDLFVEMLNILEKSYDPLILKYFELKLIEFSGFKPELYNCVHCKKRLCPGQNYWDLTEGGVTCADCQSKTKHGKSISDDAIKLLRLIETSDFGHLRQIKAAEKIKIELGRILSNYIENILEKKLKSTSFLEEFGGLI